MFEAGLGGKECAVKMDGEHLLPFGEGKFFQRMDDLYPGIA